MSATVYILRKPVDRVRTIVYRKRWFQTFVTWTLSKNSGILIGLLWAVRIIPRYLDKKRTTRSAVAGESMARSHSLPTVSHLWTLRHLSDLELWDLYLALIPVPPVWARQFVVSPSVSRFPLSRIRNPDTRLHRWLACALALVKRIFHFTEYFFRAIIFAVL